MTSPRGKANLPPFSLFGHFFFMSASDIQTVKSKAQELFACAEDLRDAIEQIGTNALRGAKFPDIPAAQITQAINNDIKTQRANMTAILAVIDQKLTLLGVS